MLNSRMEAASSSKEAPKPAPAWELKDVNGKRVKSDDFKGKVVLLDFWATWCGPCKAEIPGFIQLHKKYSDKGVVVIGISMDEEGPAVVKKFIEKNNVNYPIVMADKNTPDLFGGVEAIPTTFIIDREGQIVNKHEGQTEKSEFESEIKKLLK